ncbi:MAG: Isochorismate synthase MenF [Chlamydiales bacterium]|nr:Isochorismate synthase MenF [Chlamydiales bacterium]MCH9635952.1 Isochorismate synthase MenF [Chlamydiales bacterium]
MSTQSTTIWTSDSQLPEGTLCLHSGDGSGPTYLACNPDRKVEVELGPNCWDELQEQIGDDLYFGFINYEMGCYTDWGEIPHAPLKRGALFYRPTEVIRLDKLPDAGDFDARLVGSSETVASYCQKVRQIQEEIACGNVYQVNLSQELHFQTKGSPYSLFHKVSQGHPYSAFVQTDQETIVSASPELFLKSDGRTVTTAPIKGTAPRGSTPKEDEQNRNELLQSEKERAELMMIVDLLRNDLHRICDQVVVEKLCQLESFPTLFHLVSTIKGSLVEQNPIQILKALFPGGSISGCPKISALKLISQLENSARGPYTGAIGFIHGKQMHFNLAIRTAIWQENQMRLRLGGAIIADSNPIKEYEETLHKGKAFCSSISMESLSNMRAPKSPSTTAAFSSEMASSQPLK